MALQQKTPAVDLFAGASGSWVFYFSVLAGTGSFRIPFVAKLLPVQSAAAAVAIFAV